MRWFMKQSYYIFSHGELKRKDNTLQIIKEDGSKSDIPIERIYDLYIFSEITLNLKLLNLLSQYHVNVHFFNYYGYYIGSFCPKEKNVSGHLIVEQVRVFLNQDLRLSIAKEFINAASYNIYRNLRYYNERGRNLENEMNAITHLRSGIQNAESVPALMGVEGNIRQVYYKTWTDIILQDVEFDKRVRRPPDNMVNTLISFLNSVMYSKVLSEIYVTQLNPTISYLHEPSQKRFSLALDLAEVFKPLIVDRLLFALLNKRIISEVDFFDEGDYLRIKDSSIKKIMQHFEERMKTTIKHKTLNQEVSYQHLIRLEAYKLIKKIIGEQEYDAFKIWW